ARGDVPAGPERPAGRRAPPRGSGAARAYRATAPGRRARPALRELGLRTRLALAVARPPRHSRAHGNRRPRFSPGHERDRRNPLPAVERAVRLADPPASPGPLRRALPPDPPRDRLVAGFG